MGWITLGIQLVIAYGLSFGLEILAKPLPAPAPAGEPAKLRSCLKKPAKEPEPKPEPKSAPAEPKILDLVIKFLFKNPEQTIPMPVPTTKDFKIKATPTRAQIVSRWIIQREHCHNRSSEKRRWVYDGGDEDVIMHNGCLNGE